MSTPVYGNFQPFFSVVICTFNRADRLPQAVESVVNQKETDWEIVVVDDGSSDNTFEVVKHYIERGVRLRYMYHGNRGTALSRNAGITAAVGLFVTFLDSDDYYRQDHLYVRRQILIENPEIDLLHGGVTIVGSEFVPDKNDPERLISIKSCVVGGTFVMRREKMLDLDGFPPVRFADDTQFFEKAMQSDMSVARIDIPSYVYVRTSPDSLCNIVERGGLEGIEEYVRGGGGR